MNKQELIKKIAAETGVSQKETASVLESTMLNIMEAVAAGDKVQLIGFGTFEGRKREARTGINPVTKEKIEIKASVVPAFKPSTNFKSKLNG